MTAKKRGLGRGLDALLGDAVAVASPVDGGLSAQSAGMFTVAVDLIGRSPWQPRREIDPDQLEDLANSIRAQGLIQPIVVRPATDGRYELIAGERRWRAVQLAGLHEIPVVVRQVSDQSAMAMALIENIQRENLNPLDEALALRRLLEEFGMTHQQVAASIGRSRTSVTNLLRLLELNEDTKALLAQGDLEMGHARALLGLQGTDQLLAARTVVSRGLSVRETERLVRKMLAPDAGKKTPNRPLDPDVRRLQENLSSKIGCPVRIQHSAKGRGRLIIDYTNLDELDGILAHIR